MSEWISRLRSFVIRHRVTITELSMLAAVMAVASYLAFDIDIFVTEASVSSKQEKIELDEALMLGGLLAIGLLIFSIRRYIDQRQETRARIFAETQARELAFQDSLTGLPNRRQFDDALKTAIAAPPRAGATHALLLLDLNGFKQVNDVHGHNTGDHLLSVVAQRLQSVMRQGDMVARFGGDEFAVLGMHLVGADAAAGIAERVIQTLTQPIFIKSTRHNIGVGIGIALLEQGGLTPTEALRRADVALYRAKAEKRSTMRFFDEGMDHVIYERAGLEKMLRDGLEKDEFSLVYRPVHDLHSQMVIGFEASPRWHHDGVGDVEPERFIPLAEDVGLIHELGERLLVKACGAVRQWPQHVWLSIDLFPMQLAAPDLAERIRRTLFCAGVDPNRLQLEITESALVDHLSLAKPLIETLRASGVKVVLDNFGTGYSSLKHLRQVKLDKVKIDRSYIEKMASEAESKAIVNALVSLGRGFGMEIAAEGVNDLRQGTSLLGTGCDEGQGDLYGAALTDTEVATLMKKASVKTPQPRTKRKA